MVKQVIGVGAAANDGTGDPVRNAMVKINSNFTELYDNQFSGLYSDLTQRPTSLLFFVNDGEAGQVLTTDGNGVITFEDAVEVGAANTDPTEATELSLSLGKINSSDDFIPFVVQDIVSNTMQDAIPATNVVNGLIEKVIFSKQLSRYTSGGELLLTFICNTNGETEYSTRKYTFSRVENGTYDLTEMGSGSDNIYDSIIVTERTLNGNLFLEVTARIPTTGPPAAAFVRCVGHITYTSVPIYVTASGY